MRRGRRNRFITPVQQGQHRINDKIKAQQVRVIDSDGEQIGIKPLQDALVLASQKQLDLVEIAPQASPPVCKLIDYGKYKYQLQKKEAEAKKNQQDNVVKELKVGYRTDIGDLKTKLKHARSFLSDGNKVKISMRFKGRERAFAHLGREKLEEMVNKLSDVAKVYEQNFKNRHQVYITVTPD